MIRFNHSATFVLKLHVNRASDHQMWKVVAVVVGGRHFSTHPGAALAHVGALSTVHEIICVRFVVKLQIRTVSGSTHVGRCDCSVIIVYNIRREMLLPVPKHSH